MKKIIFYILLPILAYSICDDNADKLAVSYNQISHCQDNYIIWNDGTKMLYDDGKKKSFNRLLNFSDIEDMFYFKYPKNSFIPPKYNQDAGRIRNDAFFKKMYGDTKAKVIRNLTTIKWLPSGKKIRVTTINGIDKKLYAISKELNNLPKKFKKYIINIGGTFNWRNIAGTNRLSSHSFGISIDINTKYSAYWKWSKGKYRYKNKIPKEIVKIFEKYGFIWGGKWYHYDTMHFEYRPKLLR